MVTVYESLCLKFGEDRVQEWATLHKLNGSEAAALEFPDIEARYREYMAVMR